MFYHLPVHQRIAVPDSMVTLPAICDFYNQQIVKGFGRCTGPRLPQGCMILCEYFKCLVAKELGM